MTCRKEQDDIKTGVLSVAGNGAPLSASGVGQEGERKRSIDDVSKPLDEIETGSGGPARDEPGGCLLIGQVVSGMEVARAWPGLWCGTCEPVVPIGRLASGARIGPAAGCLEREPQVADPRGGE